MASQYLYWEPFSLLLTPRHTFQHSIFTLRHFCLSGSFHKARYSTPKPWHLIFSGERERRSSRVDWKIRVVMRRLWLAVLSGEPVSQRPLEPSERSTRLLIKHQAGHHPPSAGRRCSLPAEFKVHSHLLPGSYPEPQNGVRYALIKLSWFSFDSLVRRGLVMKRLCPLKMNPSQLAQYISGTLEELFFLWGILYLWGAIAD